MHPTYYVNPTHPTYVPRAVDLIIPPGSSEEAAATILANAHLPVLWSVEILHERLWCPLIDYAKPLHAVELAAVLRGYGCRARVRPLLTGVR